MMNNANPTRLRYANTQLCMQGYLLENCDESWHAPINPKLYREALKTGPGRAKLASHHAERFMLFSILIGNPPGEAQFPGIPHYSRRDWLDKSLELGALICARELSKVICATEHRAFSSVLGEPVYTRTIRFSNEFNQAGKVEQRSLNKTKSVEHEDGMFTKLNPNLPAKCRQQLRYAGITAFIQFWRKRRIARSSPEIDAMYVEVLASLFPRQWQVHHFFLYEDGQSSWNVPTKVLTKAVNQVFATSYEEPSR